MKPYKNFIIKGGCNLQMRLKIELLNKDTTILAFLAALVPLTVLGGNSKTALPDSMARKLQGKRTQPFIKNGSGM